MVGRRNAHDGIATKPDAADAARGGPGYREAHIGGTVGDECGDLVGVRVAHRDAAGKRRQGAEHEGNDARRERRVHRDDEARHALGAPRLLDGFVGQRDAASRVGEQCLAGGSERRTPRGPLEHRAADRSLEVPDPLAHGRLRHEQFRRRPPEAAVAFDREEHREVPKIERHRQSL